MKVELPQWALEAATGDDLDRAREAQRLGAMRLLWPELEALRAWAKGRGWPRPWLSFQDAFVAKMLESREDFAAALAESGIAVRLPKRDHTLSAADLAGLDAMYEPGSAQRAPQSLGPPGRGAPGDPPGGRSRRRGADRRGSRPADLARLLRLGARALLQTRGGAATPGSATTASRVRLSARWHRAEARAAKLSRTPAAARKPAVDFSDPVRTNISEVIVAGPARVRQLRQEAGKRGLDPNVWFGNVEQIASERIGRETVTYVSNIYKYYVAYTLLVEDRARREESKKAVEAQSQQAASPLRAGKEPTRLLAGECAIRWGRDSSLLGGADALSPWIDSFRFSSQERRHAPTRTAEGGQRPPPLLEQAEPDPGRAALPGPPRPLRRARGGRLSPSEPGVAVQRCGRRPQTEL